jgi:hypothetical protein
MVIFEVLQLTLALFWVIWNISQTTVYQTFLSPFSLEYNNGNLGPKLNASYGN